MQLKDARVIITGASQGIGRALALEFSGRGARVALAARSEPALDELATEIRGQGGEAVVIPTDVTVPAQVERMARETIRALGGIDVLVNNAGVGLNATIADAEKVARRIAAAAERNRSSVYVSWIPDRMGVAANHLAGWAVTGVLRRWARSPDAGVDNPPRPSPARGEGDSDPN